jgi:hypothetical protein
MGTFWRMDGWIKTAIGPAVAGAQIYVCAPQPANVGSAPPSPLAFIFSDPNGLVPVAQPLIADGLGHYDFYALAGLYTIVVAFGGKVSNFYPDQSLGAVGTGQGGNPYIAGANINIIGNVISATNPSTSFLIPINNQPGSNYDLQVGDNNTYVLMSSGSANTVTIKPDATLNLPLGFNVSVRQTGAGQTTIVPGAGVTLTGPGSSFALRAQNASAQLVKVAANTWALIGDVVGV